MPSQKRYSGTVHCHVPERVRVAIEKMIAAGELTKSDAVRELLAEGLRVRGIECVKI